MQWAFTPNPEAPGTRADRRPAFQRPGLVSVAPGARLETCHGSVGTAAEMQRTTTMTVPDSRQFPLQLKSIIYMFITYNILQLKKKTIYEMCTCINLLRE